MMTIEQKLREMESTGKMNPKQYYQYSNLIRVQRAIDFAEDLWDYCKGTVISAGIGVLIGYIILWIAGC